MTTSAESREIQEFAAASWVSILAPKDADTTTAVSPGYVCGSCDA